MHEQICCHNGINNRLTIPVCRIGKIEFFEDEKVYSGQLLNEYRDKIEEGFPKRRKKGDN